MKMMKARLTLCLSIFCALCLSLCSLSASAQQAGDNLRQALESNAKVQVMIALREPAPLFRLQTRAQFLSERAAGIEAIRRSVLARLSAKDFTLTHQWEAISAVAGQLSKSGLDKLLADPNVLRVDLDEGGSGQLAQSVPLIHGNIMNTRGFTGLGVVVAVLDSGIDTDHPDLSNDLIAQQCFCTNSNGTGCCPNGSTEQAGAGSAEDNNGHGTNVSGIITSTGTVSSKGVAPDAKIVAVKVLDANNGFNSTAQVISGLNWIIMNRPDVRVINMSLGTNARFSGTCDNAASFTIAFAQAINTLKSQGVTTFVSSGNNGSLTQLQAPACVANSVAVGAVYDSNVGSVTILGCTDSTTATDKVTCFTNSNSTLDLLGPGAPITSTGVGGGLSTYYGTSQASPHAAGAAAALLQFNPLLTPDQIEGKLKTSGVSVVDVRNGLTFTRLDLLNACSANNRASKFDDDAKADIAVWSPANGNWYVSNSKDGTSRVQLDWGRSSLGDVAVPGDYDGDGRTDIAVWRSGEGNWYIIQSMTNSVTLKNWGGGSGDVPVPGDYDGDGRTDVAVFRKSEGNWYVLKSSGGVTVQSWGNSTDKPVPGNYDSDCKTDIAVFRPNEANWYILKSGGGVTVQNWGASTDRPVPADYDGDGKTDVGVFRPADGNWYILRSGGGQTVQNWGDAGDKQVPGDYDGDLRADIAVWRPTDGNWYVINSSTNTPTIRYLGQSGDVPVPSTYIP